jgi:ketosteroid isomerase-like protein
MNPDSDAEVVRRFYRALAEADWTTAEGCFAPDAVWHLPGSSAVAGDYHGWGQIRDDFLRHIGPLSGGTFRAELLDVAVGEHFIVAVQHATATHQGRTLDVTGCQLMHVSDGVIHEVRGHYSDQTALDAFWVV